MGGLPFKSYYCKMYLGVENQQLPLVSTVEKNKMHESAAISSV
jgi:hypothetical protein